MFPFTVYKELYPVKKHILRLHTRKFGNMILVLSKNKDKRIFYISPNESVWASTFYIGPDKEQSVKAHIRRELLGHNYDVRANNELIQAIESNIYVSELWILHTFREKNKGSRRY